MVKRIVDVFISLLVLIFSIPLIFLVSLLIIIIDKHNPFFSQYRSGINSKKFRMYKFKSMKYDENTNQLVVTSFGNYIRLFKIDELLQIINVLKNDMSIIGPRPLYTDFDKYYKKRHKLRLKVKPGITGLAQIKIKDSTNWNLKFNYDVIYVKHFSLKLDLYILMKTFLMVINTIFNKKNRPSESLDYKKDFFENYL